MTTYRDRLNDTFNHFASIMAEDTRGVKITCYSVAVIGLTIAIRRVRPFSRFKRPSDVPTHFIKEGRELVGTVESIDPIEGLLLIRHKPLLSIPFVSPTTLPVKLSGVNVTRHGISWLQTIVTGSEVKLIPVLKENNWLQCEVSLEQLTHDKKVKKINIAESLVSVGFANLETTNIGSKRYHKQLHRAELEALRKKLGVKFYIKSTNEVIIKLFKIIYNTIMRTSSKMIIVR